MLKILTENQWRIALFGCTLTYFMIFSLLGIWRHWGYMTSVNDLGCYDQAIWTATQGQSLLNSINLGYTINWLGFHFQPILYTFAPLYKIYPTPHWLTLSQSAALSLSALPIYAIARHVTNSEKKALIWTLIYLLNPFLIAAVTWDFHEVSLATLFISLGLYAITQKRLLLLIISSIFLLACKEHFGLTVAGLGFIYGVIHKNRIVSATFLVIGIMMTALIIGVVMPSYSPTGQHLMIKPENGMHTSNARYGWLGNSLSSATKNLFLHPFIIIKTALLTMKGAAYLLTLLAPFLFLSVAAPIWIIPITGDLLVNLLSANPMHRSIFSYHSATIIPLLTVAAIYGLPKFTPYLKKFSVASILKHILFLNIILAYFFFPFSLPGSMNFWHPANIFASFDNREIIVKRMLENRSISVQANLGSHFAERSSVFRFPDKIGDVDFIVLKLESPTKTMTPEDPAFIGTLAYHLQIIPETYLTRVENILNSKDYEPLYWDDPWLVLSKGETHQSSKTVQQIRTKLLMLREEWTTQRN
ncbi:MAG: DUF2079 domain-containing protein [Methylomicrobium sp.]